MVSQAASLEIAEGKAKVKRQTEYGYDVIETPLPCVVAVSDAINEPRYPSLKGIMGAKKKPQETLGASDLGVGADEAGENGSRTEVYALGDPPSRGDSRRIEDENGNAADAIVTYLQEKKLI
jgi:electron transfer flavoprotein beta subunit